MIKYRLQCGGGHVFDDWFDSMAAYDQRQSDGDLACPECGDTQVRKSLMAPSVAGASAAPEPAAPTCGLPGGCAGGMCGLG